MPIDSVPLIFTGLVDDAAYLSGAGSRGGGSLGPLTEAVAGHRAHRTAWYASLVGPLILPASALSALATLPMVEGSTAELAGGAELTGESAGGGEFADGDRLVVGVLGDSGPEALARSISAAGDRVEIAHVEAAVAKRGEDPRPGLRRFLGLLGGLPSIPGYAEIPLTWGLLTALDTLAEARAGGVPVSAKFRTGGLAAELFPTPVELAAVICACRDRRLRFKLTAGLRRAVRHTEPETGFVHHGFLNVLVASVTAARGAEVAEVAEILAITDPVSLAERSRDLRALPRPLWDGFGARVVTETLTDLRQLALLVSDSM